MISLDAASVLLQWCVGGMAFLWVTTRHREVSLGYGQTMRLTYAALAAISLGIGLFVIDPVPVREASTAALLLVTLVGLVQSIRRRAVGVSGNEADRERRSARVAAMTGFDLAPVERDPAAIGPEFDPRLDLASALVGIPGLVAAGMAAGDPEWLSVARMVVGAAFIGAINDAMLLGHWYLVQPGLARKHLLELVRWCGYLWPFELAVLLVPTGMVSVLNGTIDDGYNGLLGWFWAACVVTTIGLAVITRLALRERSYSAVMAATGLLYLAILTSWGMDLVARAALAFRA